MGFREDVERMQANVAARLGGAATLVFVGRGEYNTVKAKREEAEQSFQVTGMIPGPSTPDTAAAGARVERREFVLLASAFTAAATAGFKPEQLKEIVDRGKTYQVLSVQPESMGTRFRVTGTRVQ